jgi:hypothetical protein
MKVKSVYRKYEKYLSKSSQRLRVNKEYIFQWIEILFGNDAKLIRRTKLSKEEKIIIEDYWKQYYGRKIPLLWHRKYKAYSGKLDKRYFPEYLYTPKLEPKMQDDNITRVLSDKNLIEMLFARILKDSDNIKIPKTLCGCSHGYYFDGNRKPITHEKCEDIIKHISEYCIIKPTIGESSGHGVRLLHMAEGIDKNSNMTADEIISAYKGDFII